MSRKRPPLPGSKVRGSATGRPIMAALDLFGRRWALRILWELRAKSLTFRELQDACGEISPAVLNTRLAELREQPALANMRVLARGNRLSITPVDPAEWKHITARMLKSG